MSFAAPQYSGPLAIQNSSDNGLQNCEADCCSDKFVEEDECLQDMNGDLDTFLDPPENDEDKDLIIGLRSKDSIQASSDWKTEVAIVRAMYADRIIKDFAEVCSNSTSSSITSSGDCPDRGGPSDATGGPGWGHQDSNRFFTMVFRSPQILEIHELNKAKLENEINKKKFELGVKEREVKAFEAKKTEYSKKSYKNIIDDLRKSVINLEHQLQQELRLDSYQMLHVNFRFTSRYPRMILDIVLENNGGLNGSQVQNLYKETTRVMRENLGTPMLFKTIDVIQAFYDDALPIESVRHQRLEKAEEEALRRLAPKADSETSAKSVVASPNSESCKDPRQYPQQISNMVRYDISDPGKWVGNINHLLRKLSDKVKVVNVENILRADLVQRFEKYRSFLRNKYLEGAHNKHHRVSNTWAESEVAFHGTREENVGSIVSNGLVVPKPPDSIDNEDNHVKVASGSRYGLGIYTSPDINFSLHYTRGSGRLLVVAVLPGRKFICNDSNVKYGGSCTPGYDSHQSEDKRELVLFKASAVLPCYVIHYKPSTRLSDKPMGAVIENKLLHEDPVINYKLTKKKNQEELRAKAMKTLGYGFGPAGRKFVVEAVFEGGELQEDLSNYQNIHEHQYQVDRGL